jgi:hypothetical protein
MWLLLFVGVLWLGILIYEFSTGRLIGRNWGTQVTEERNSEMFWAMYALHVFSFLFYIAFLIWTFYFKGRY